MLKYIAPITIAASLIGTATHARDEIQIVGSSTVFPFATAVAEAYAKDGGVAPAIESTGSSGGLKLFCEGVGFSTPDISNASRRIKAKEIKRCAENGVTEIVEIEIGFDGIVIVNDTDGPDFELSPEHLFTAMAKGYGEPAKWSEVDPSLPDVEIVVYGPPEGSGTRDAFIELALQKGCRAAGHDKATCKSVEIRSDAAYVETGENDALVINTLREQPNAVGIMGFSFLDANSDRVKGALVEGVEPTFENIADGVYPVARGLYFYVKKAHVGVIPGLAEFVSEFVSDDAIGEFGYLTDRGLIPLPEERLQEVQDTGNNMTTNVGPV